MPRFVLPAVLLSMLLVAPVEAQRLVTDQKTVEIQAHTKDAAYAENTRTANKILQAILDTGVPKEAIETESLRLEQEEERYGQKPDQPRKYSGNQKWQVHLKASDAQRIVDIAVAAGANQIENVEWLVSDPQQLETKAYAAAIKRARSIAEQTASQTGLKLGDIVSISNSNNSSGRELVAVGASFGLMLDASKMPMLKLHPGTVEREASVTITYSVVAP